MSAFARGMQMGQSAWDAAENNRVRQEELAMRKAAEARAVELHGLNTDRLRREDATQRQLQGLRTEMADFTTGTDRAATNANLDADFEQAYQATALGLQAPAMVGGSNAENERALTVRRPVNPASPEFQAGMAGLRQRYALASGNMADFDAVTTAERGRLESAQDAERARLIMSNPNGPEAVQARTFINDTSRSLAIDPPDPKTGMSTLRIVRGDRTKPVELSPADLGKLAVAVSRLERGDVGGLDIISAINKDLAAATAAEFNIDLNVSKANNETAYRSAGLRNDAARLGLQSKETDARISALNDNRDRAAAGDWAIIGVTPDNRGLLRYNKNTGATQTQQLPEGVDARGLFRRVTGQQPDINVETVYESLLGTQIPGQPRGSVYTPELALSEARRIAGGQQDPFMERLDSLLGSGTDPFAPQAPARPGGASAPTRQGAAPSPAPAPRPQPRPDPNRPDPNRNPVTGAPRESAPQGPNVVEAVGRGLDSGAVRYLKGKIDRGEPLTPAETERARRYNLVP